MATDLDTPVSDSSVSDSAPFSKPVLVASAIQSAASGLLIALLFLEWVKGGHIGLAGNGGAGFGLLTLAAAVAGIVAVVSRLTHRSSWRLLGPSQLAFMLAIATFFTNLLFLWVFRTGGAPKWVYIAANLLIYSGVVGLFSDRPGMARPLESAQIRVIGVATAVLGVCIAAAPMLGYTKLGGRTLTGYEPGAPRVGVLLLLVGGVTIYCGIRRARSTVTLADIGTYVLWSHVTTGLGVLATAPAFAWVVSGLWGNNFSAGIGAFVSLVLGFALIALGLYESSRRGAPGI